MRGGEGGGKEIGGEEGKMGVARVGGVGRGVVRFTDGSSAESRRRHLGRLINGVEGV